MFHFKISFGYKNVFRFINERPYSRRQIVRLSTTYISVLSLRMHILTMFGTLKYQWRGAGIVHQNLQISAKEHGLFI